jgi:hypothetical protein
MVLRGKKKPKGKIISQFYTIFILFSSSPSPALNSPPPLHSIFARLCPLFLALKDPVACFCQRGDVVLMTRGSKRLDTQILAKFDPIKKMEIEAFISFHFVPCIPPFLSALVHL